MNKKLLLLLFSFILIITIFQPGLPSFTDNLTHVARMKFFPQTLETGWIASWSTWDFAGFPFQTIKYQIPLWLTVALNQIFSDAIAYKLSLLVSIAFPALMLFALLKKWFNEKTAFLAALLFLIQSQFLVRTLEGMFAENIAIGFLITTLYFLEYKQFIPAAFALSCTILSHPYAGLIACIATVIFWYFDKRWEYALVFLGVLASFFFWENVLIERAWYVAFRKSMTLTESLKAMGFLVLKLGDSIWSTIALSLASISAFLLAIYGFHNRRPWTTRYLLLLISSAIISTGFWFWLPIINNLQIAGLASDRFIVFIRLFLIPFAAIGLNKINYKYAFATLTVIALLFPIMAPQSWTATAEPPELFNIVKTLPGEGRIAYEVCDMPARMRSLGPYYTGRDNFGGWFGSNPQFPIEANAKLFFDKANTKELMDNYTDAYAIRYVAACKNTTRTLLQNSTIEADGYTIHDMGEKSLVQGANATVTYTTNQYRIQIHGIQNTTGTLKIQYHPYWSAELNGKPVQLSANDMHTTNIPLETGELILNFNVRRTEMIISSLLWLLLLLWILLWILVSLF